MSDGLLSARPSQAEAQIAMLSAPALPNGNDIEDHITKTFANGRGNEGAAGKIPPPPSKERLAALTIASTLSVVMSLCNAVSFIAPSAARDDAMPFSRNDREMEPPRAAQAGFLIDFITLYRALFASNAHTTPQQPSDDGLTSNLVHLTEMKRCGFL